MIAMQTWYKIVKLTFLQRYNLIEIKLLSKWSNAICRVELKYVNIIEDWNQS